VAEAIALAATVDASARGAWNGLDLLKGVRAEVAAASPLYAEFARCLDLAITLLADGVDAATGIRVLGTSAWSREAVPCALYCAAHSGPDIERALLDAVNESGGAAESIATIVGAVGGALVGADGLPERWRGGVEASARIVTTALALAALA
jgi:ADP-ribosylglycohydrolase